MSSSNPYASGGSQRGYDAPKKKKNKWLWIGLPILLLIIIGAVLGGVLGTQLNKDDDNSSNSGSSNSNNGQPANTGVPSGVSDVSTNTQTGANGGRILAIQTDSYLLPVYATGVSRRQSHTSKHADVRPKLLDTLPRLSLPMLPTTASGPATPRPLATNRSALTRESVLPATSGLRSPR